ncbi:hypothetical protein [Desulforamulus ruminis]|uniref:hypothetical protein n=1 Tax=Desulforamulus ruminis TaxID=1564 RepID=UPI002352A4EF|nr:hypothetical protein [Desulforamulus ruminis]
MLVHSVLSSYIAGFGYENGTLRVVLKGKTGLKAYDYFNVTQEDAGIFAQGLGKSLNYIKGKYDCKPVTDKIYFSE